MSTTTYAGMSIPTNRRTVDLSGFPDLVVIYLGMIVRDPQPGMDTLMYFASAIQQVVGRTPPGLLLHEDIIYSQDPLHYGMRQYWRDFDSLERFARSEPHREWWAKMVRDSAGTGFWHEAYLMRGGMECAYVDLAEPYGMLKFAPALPMRGHMLTARGRLGIGGDETGPRPVSEDAS